MKWKVFIKRFAQWDNQTIKEKSKLSVSSSFLSEPARRSRGSRIPALSLTPRFMGICEDYYSYTPSERAASRVAPVCPEGVTAWLDFTAGGKAVSTPQPREANSVRLQMSSNHSRTFKQESDVKVRNSRRQIIWVNNAVNVEAFE